MEQELRIKIRIDKQTGELQTVSSEFNKINDSAQKTDKSTKQLKTSTDGLGGAFSKLKGIVASYLGLQTFSEYAKTSDAMALLEARIKLVSKASDDYATTQKDLVDVAQENKVAYSSIGTLYARLSPAMRTLNADTRTVVDVTDAFSKSLLVSGASTEEAASSSIQFSQAMASGVLRGDEFNSMMENSPRAARALMDTLGKTQGELRKMAENGELASGIVAGALLRSLTQLQDEASKMPNTISGEFQRIKNEAALLVEDLNKKTNINTNITSDFSLITKELAKLRDNSDQFTDSLLNVYNNTKNVVGTLYDMRDIIGGVVAGYASFKVGGMIAVGMATVSTAVESINTALKSATISQLAFNTAAKANPYILGATIIGTTAYAAYDLVKSGNEELQKAYEEDLAYWNKISQENAEKAKTKEGLLSTAEAYEQKYQDIFEKTGNRIEAYKTQAQQLRNIAESLKSETEKGDIEKERKATADALVKQGQEQVATTKRIKESTASINTQISALEKQYSVQKEIENLNVESALLADSITKPEAEYLKEINDIKSEIAKNQATINLLNSKEYDKNDTSADTDKIKDLEKINELKKDNELLTRKQTAAEEKKQAAIKAANEEVKNSIDTMNVSDTDKAYIDLIQKVKELVASGADLKLVGDYAEKLANQIARDDAYAHLQTELDIRTQIAEVSLYGSEKETAQEQIRHDSVMANLSRELEQNKLNADEYLKLLGIEKQRHAQNADSFYQFMLTSFDNINKALDENFFNVLTGKFKSWGAWLKDFFSSMGTSVAQGLSRTLAGSFTNTVQSGIVNLYQTYGGLSASSSLVGETVSASDLSKITGLSGTTVSDGKITTSGGTVIDQATGQVKSQGSDALSVINTASSLKTVYGLVTDGISGSIVSGFNTASGLLANLGFTNASSGLMSFGTGIANPFAYSSMTGLPTSMTVGSALSGTALGGVSGYLLGSLGDKIFGANTYAGTTGAIGGALGGLGGALGLWGGPIGILAGSVIGSVLGGLFGKIKVTGQGIDILGNATAESAAGRYYTSYKKKSWFSSKSWEDYTGFNAEEINAIKQTIGVYDYLLNQLGEYNDLVVSGGRFSNLQSFLDTNVVKAFLVSINPNNLDIIYQSWTDYAASVDETITQALSTAVSGYTTYKRGYTEWVLGSGTVEQLQYTANYLQNDFEALASSLGASSVTVDNFLSMYDAAIKNNFTQDTIEAWASLGDALMKSTDATKKYQEALDSLNSTTSYSLPTDMLLQNIAVAQTPLDLGTLINAQTSGNKNLTKMVSYLYEIVKSQQELLKVTKYGTNRGIPA